MTEAKHTPAPWEVGDHRQIWAGEVPIAEIIPNPPMLENEANARLIAAAPEMLAALQEVASFHFGSNNRLGKVVRTAIAAATGSE